MYPPYLTPSFDFLSLSIGLIALAVIVLVIRILFAVIDGAFDAFLPQDFGVSERRNSAEQASDPER